jgi:SAM-dependent methyltransferase
LEIIMSTHDEPRDLTTIVRERYGQAARRASEGAAASCCGPASSCCGASAASGTADPITSNLYVNGETASLPPAAVLASLGCGNPTALAQLALGDVVLDLGSGGGIDVLLSARRVGPTGKAYGLDMTDEMLDLARKNASEAGVANVEFLKGRIEAIPLPDNSVDVVISNCVINLSGDKRTVLAEAYRVLKPGGRFAVSDVVVRGELPAAARRSMELWVGCVAGALEESEFTQLLGDVGFEAAEIEPTRVYDIEDAREFLAGAGLDVDEVANEIQGKVMGAFIRARKPGVSRTPAFRPATASDLTSIERLLATAGLTTAGIADILEARASDFLRSVAVRPEWQQRGLGRELVRRLVCEAEGRGLRALYLLTLTAEHYFPRLGFERIERGDVPPEIADTLEFKNACPASAVVMVRTFTR